MDFLTGGAIGAVAIFGTLVATKGLPAAWATVKGWAGKGKAELAALKGDLADAHAKADTLIGEIASFEKKWADELAAVKARLDKAGIAA